MIARFALALALLGGLAAAQTAHGWRRYQSASQRFAAYYPPTFYLLNPRVLGLEVVNVPRSQLVSGGPVVPEDGADIFVRPLGRPGQTINGLIVQEQRSADGAPIIDQTLVTDGLGPNGCPTLHQVENYENYGSAKTPVLAHLTSYYCTVHGRIFVVRLFYWRGNKDSKTLESFARTVAMTLRIYR